MPANPVLLDSYCVSSGQSCQRVFMAGLIRQYTVLLLAAVPSVPAPVPEPFVVRCPGGYQPPEPQCFAPLLSEGMEGAGRGGKLP
jgi:hypothetical protein